MKFRIRVTSGPYKGQYFMSQWLGTVDSKDEAHIYTSLPESFDKRLHVLELVL